MHTTDNVFSGYRMILFKPVGPQPKSLESRLLVGLNEATASIMK